MEVFTQYLSLENFCLMTTYHTVFRILCLEIPMTLFPMGSCPQVPTGFETGDRDCSVLDRLSFYPGCTCFPPSMTSVETDNTGFELPQQMGKVPRESLCKAPSLTALVYEGTGKQI